MSLSQYLSKKGYLEKKIKLTKTNHLKVTAKINGVKGRFILDSGASNTCIDSTLVDKFKLNPKNSNTKAAGAGAINMDTQIAKKATIKIGKWKSKKNSIIIFNLTHVNQALINHKSNPVDGIIGADILKKGKGIINYETNKIHLK